MPNTLFVPSVYSFVVRAEDVYLRHAACYGVEAGRENNHIQLHNHPVPQFDASLRDLFDRVGIDVHDVDVRHAHDFVEILLERRPFGAPWVGQLFRRQKSLFLWIRDAREDLLAPEAILLPCLLCGL